MADDRRLIQLAGKDKVRLTILEARKKRCKSRTRVISCPSCGDSGYDDLDQADICRDCLADLWGARDVMAGEFNAASKSGLIPVNVPCASHHMAYPHMKAGSYDYVPKSAVFARYLPEEKRYSDNAARVMQTLFWELIAGLGKVLPVDPDGRSQAEDLFQGDGSSYRQDAHYARLPREAVKTIKDLWHFIIWTSAVSFKDGFNSGHDLLGRMNLGQVTHEGFQEEIRDQTTNALAIQAKAVNGGKRP